MARTAAPQVPGDAPAEKPAEDLVGEAAPVESDELAAVKAELAQMKALMAGIINARAQPAPVPAVREADLPDQSTIDPAKIAQPTLSRQGWVLPSGFAAPPAAAKAV